MDRLVAGLLVLLLLLQIVSDRTAPASSIGTVEGLVLPISPRISGELKRVAVSDNQIVEAGTLLAEIDPTPFQLAVEAAQAELERVGQSIGASTANVAAAQARLAETQAVLVNTKAQADRTLELVRRGVTPAADGDEATAAVASGEASVAAAEAELRQAEEALGPAGENNPELRAAQSALETAQFDLSQTKIVAPTRGRVTNFSLGPGETATAGQPILSMIDIGRLDHRLLPREPARQHAGRRPAEVVLDVFPGRVWPAKLDRSPGGIMTVNQEAKPGGLVETPPQSSGCPSRSASRSASTSTRPARCRSGCAWAPRRRWSTIPRNRSGCGRSGSCSSGPAPISPMSTDRPADPHAAQVLRVALVTPVIYGVAVWTGTDRAVCLGDALRDTGAEAAGAAALKVVVLLALLLFLLPLWFAGIASVLGQYSYLLLGFVGLMLFHAFRLQAAPKTALVGVLLQTFAIMLPIVTGQSDTAGEVVSGSFAINGVLAVAGLYLAFAFFPASAVAVRGAAAPPAKVDRRQQTRDAAVAALVMLPPYALLLAFELTSAMRVLFTIAAVLAALSRRDMRETGAESVLWWRSPARWRWCSRCSTPSGRSRRPRC